MSHKKNPSPRAVVREVDGVLVLDDPDAVEVVRAVAKHNCRLRLEQNAERVVHFRRRNVELGHSWEATVIVILNVDDSRGGLLAHALMPGHDWNTYRRRGETPFARGLAGREGVEAFLADFDKAARNKLQSIRELAVVVVDHGVAEAFAASEVNHGEARAP